MTRHDSPWILLATVWVGVLLAGVFLRPTRINLDCALYLHEAELILDGAVPYQDFVDTNPPLIMYLSVVPVLLARILGISPILAFNGLLVLLLIGSASQIHLLLRRTGSTLLASERGLILLSWIALFMIVDWRRDVGEREHLFVLLYSPYLFLRILRHQGGSVPGWWAVLLGLQAGLGASIKPHFLLVALAVELALLASTRRYGSLTKPENLALPLIVSAYLTHWLVVPAEMRVAFFSRWLPMISQGYGAYDTSYAEMAHKVLHSGVSATGLLVTAAAGFICIRFRFRLRSQVVAFAVFAVAGLGIVFVQKKGWGYHRIPFETAAGMVLVLLVIQTARLLRRAPWRPCTATGFAGRAYALGCLGLLLAACQVVAGSEIVAGSEPYPHWALRRVVEQYTRPGDPVLFVSTSVGPAYPILLQTGRRPASRYLCCFPIAFFYGPAHGTGAEQPCYRRWTEAPEQEQQFLAELKQDVHRHQPKLILIRDRAGSIGCPDWFNHFDYLVHSGWAEQALRDYVQVQGPEAWKVLVRNQ